MSRPEDMLDAADAYIAELGGLHVPPEHRWIVDQHDAAAAELEPSMAELARIMGGEKVEKEPSRESVAVHIALSEAISRRVQWRCPHSVTLTPPPLFVVLGPGVMACKPCVMAARSQVVTEDDSRCDLCDASATIFTSAWVRFGPALVHGDYCDECRGWLV